MNRAIDSNASLASTVRVIEHVGTQGVLQSELITHGLDAIPVDRAARDTRRRLKRLAISDNVGSSGGHVVVVHVNGFSTTLTYTSTRCAHTAHLRNVLELYSSDEVFSTCGARYELHAGRYTRLAHSNLEDYVKFFGSRLVVAIDREHARRQLERFVRMTDVIVLLKWTHRNHVGQCTFLRQGNVHLISTAVAHTGGPQRRVGLRLDQLLGGDSTRTFLITAVAVVFTGLTNCQSMRSINDEIEKALLRYLETTDAAVLAAAVDHAILISSCLRRIRGALVRLGYRPADASNELAAPCWEKHPSEVAALCSHLLEQGTDRHILHALLTEAGAASEALEQAAFKLTFVPPQPDRKDIVLLGYLADLVTRGTCEYVRCLAQAQHIRRTSVPARSALERLLATVDRLADYERRSAASVRVLDAVWMQGARASEKPTVLLEIGRAFSLAIEALARCSLIARDYAFGTMSGAR